MGFLDGIRERVSGAVSQVKTAVTETAQKVEKAAVEVGHAAQSTFDPKPSAPTAPGAGAPVSSNPVVSAKSLISGALNGDLNKALTNHVGAAGATAEGTPEGAAAEADAMIKRNKSLGGLNLKEEALAQEMVELNKKDPAHAAAVLKEVIKQLPPSDKDDVAQEFADRSSKEDLQKLAMIPAGKEALREMQKQLKDGFATSGEDESRQKIENAINTVSHADTDPKLHTSQLELAAAATYELNGNKPFNLNDPAAVKDLIVNSPQLDNIKGGTDGTRCGGASVLNAMLLDGNPKGNAEAIEKTMAKPDLKGLNPTDEEKSALAAMKSGTMTPTNAAHLQELLVRMAQTPRAADPANFHRADASASGLTTPGMAAFAGELRGQGAFSNLKSVDFHANAAHWTVGVTTKSGETLTANSFPDKSGKASVNPGPPPANPRDASFTDLRITNQPDGSAVFSADGKLFVPKLNQTVTPIPKSSAPVPAGKDFDFAKLVDDFAKGGFVEN